MESDGPLDAASPPAQSDRNAPLPAVKQRLVLSSPRVRTPPAVPSLTGANARRGFSGQATARAGANVRQPQDPQLEQLVSQNAQLRDELQSLRDMYAKHTAYTELKCERMLREKDQECVEWYKSRQLDIQRTQAGVIVMHSLFQKRSRRLAAELTKEKCRHEVADADLREQVRKLEQKHQKKTERHEELLAIHTATHNSEMASVQTKKAEVEDEAARLSEQLEDARREIERQKALNSQKTLELQDARDQLIEVEKRADIDRRNTRIEDLEAELKATKTRMKEGWKKEVESLRQELMDYVRFIVHILPENWCETEAANKVPPDLKEQLTCMTGPKRVSPVKSGFRSSARGRSGQGFLPPTDMLAKGAAGSWQHANSGSLPTPSPRKRGVLAATL